MVLPRNIVRRFSKVEGMTKQICSLWASLGVIGLQVIKFVCLKVLH